MSKSSGAVYIAGGRVQISGTSSVTSAANYLEDTAHINADTGTFILGVRNDSQTTRTTSDGDYSSISVDSVGRVGISDLGGAISIDDNGSSISVDDNGISLTVDSAQLPTNLTASGNFKVAISEGNTAVTMFNEDAPHSSGDLGILMLGVRNDSGTALTTTNLDYSPLAVDSTGYLKVNINSIPPSVSTTDSISAKLATDSIMSGTASLTPGFAIISGTAGGVITLVAAQSTKKIRVLSYAISCGTNTTASFRSGTVTDVTGTFFFGPQGGAVIDFSPIGHFETAAGSALTLNYSAGTIGGHLAYIAI